jgi:choline dehydrogenase-like flavoprotein
VHSSQGLLGVSLPSITVSYDDHVIGVTKQLAEFPYRQDMNGGNPLGVGWTQSSVNNGARSSSNAAYIQPFLKRPNLTVLTGAHATRVLQTGSVKGVPVFRGVEFASSSTGQGVPLSGMQDEQLMLPTAPRIRLAARKEVVLSAGAFNTPQLLMLSGIGDPAELTAAGIKPIVDLPSVGKNMSDHVLLPNKFQVHVNDTFNTWEQPANLKPELAQWQKDHTGPISDTGFRQLGWLRVPPTDPLFQIHPDPSAGPTSPHYEFAFVVRTSLHRAPMCTTDAHG